MKKVNIIVFALVIFLSAGFTVEKVNSQTTAVTPVYSGLSAPVQYLSVGALDIVNNPNRYLNKNVKIVGKFDKFSTLGLDYPPANRSSEKYISFLIQRPDVANHNIPLSEFKIFLKKEVAEKNIDLDAGDEIEFSGKIFSVALGDPWMDVDNFKVLTKKNPPKKDENTIE